MKNILSILLTITLIFFLNSCLSKKNKNDEENKKPVFIYEEAMKSLQNKEYKIAAEKFEKIEEDHPFSEFAEKAQIMSAYSYYKAKEYEDAIRVIEFFVENYPFHKFVDYMFYLKARSLYDRIASIERSQDFSELALSSLREVIVRFPNSKYAKDAKKKLLDVQDHMAGSEMSIGRYYLNKSDFISAINRFNYVINNYNLKKHLAEAYYRLIESYLSIGMQDEAKKSYAILQKEYTDNIWTQKAKKLLNN